MKVSVRWLNALLGGAPIDGARAADALTRAGVEVEGVATIGDFSGVVVAEVRGKKPHPDATKLTLVDVFDGTTVTQVVCGAPNVPEPGYKVLWAKPGSSLPMGEGGAKITIAAKAVRGIESPGMLCAEDELGLGESHAGIIVLAPNDPLRAGDDAAKALELPDQVLDLAVGPNRPDALGHVGVARELAALLGRQWTAPTASLAPSGEIKIALVDGCSRYLATTLDGVTVAESPLSVRLRLAALGVRAISNVVDVTNLMLLEHAQPMHAFDLDRLPSAAISVRRSRAGETLETLDGVTRSLDGDLLICDGDDRPIALAGVMGGKATEVTSSTKRVLLEVAAFDAASIRRTAKRLGLQSESSHRFERGVDPNRVAESAAFAVTMLQSLAGGTVTASTDRYPMIIQPKTIALRPERARAVTGLDLDANRQAQHLASLGLDVKLGDVLTVTVPTFRPDLTREIDLVEELLRLEGYDRVPVSVPPLRTAPPELKHRVADRVRDLLNALGLDEAITYAFVAPRELAVFELPAPRHRVMRIANPLREEQSALRTTLVPGLVKAAARNVARGVSDVRLFEVGHVFLPANANAQGLPEERRHVAGILVGRRDAWLKAGEAIDYFDLRGIVDELGAGLGHTLDVVASSASWLHPGVQGALSSRGVEVGLLGELHPRIAAALDLPARALVFELDLSSVAPTPPPPLRAIPRFPSVERDASFLVAEQRSASEIANAIAQLGEPLLVANAPREDYRDPQHVPEGDKSMLWSFTYRADDRTLTDAEVKAAHERIVAALSSKVGLRLRS